MRIAVIGVGNIGNVHINAISKTDSELVAVCDTDNKKLSQYENLKLYNDYIDMLDEVKPDIVHICTPHYLHAEMVINALNRNINVLCEKPLCIKEADIGRILDAEKKSSAQLGVCFQNRYNLSTVFIKNYLKDKEIIGAHGIMMWQRDKAYYDQAEWRGTWDKEGGGVLINQALHTIDLLQLFTGMPSSVVAWCSNVSLQNIIETEDTATLLCCGENDFSLSATNASAGNFPVEIIIKTKTEKIRLFPDCFYINDEYHDCKSTDAVFGKKVYGSGHCALIEDFYDCVKTGRKFPIDGVEGVKAVRIVLAAYKSNGNEEIVK